MGACADSQMLSYLNSLRVFLQVNSWQNHDAPITATVAVWYLFSAACKTL